MTPAVRQMIEAQLARPLTHAVVMTYACGKTYRHETRSAGAAENYASHVARPKIGRDLIDRETGKTVRVVSVTVERL